MVYLLYRVFFANFVGPGWLEFKWFLSLIIVWNFIAFLGHLLREGIDPAQYVKPPGQGTYFSVNHFSDYLFYLCSLDHLFLVPSFLFLAAALKKWGKSSC